MRDPDRTTDVDPRRPDEFDSDTVFPEREGVDLRPGADSCYKCTTCDTSCPVAEVDDDFPGPKFQGPEQWRLQRGSDPAIDDSIAACSNCMRCDNACPSSVPLSRMHNVAREAYVSRELDVRSRTYVRNRLLANYRTLASIASAVPRLSNFIMRTGVVRRLTERVLGITAEREIPEFATETFREWWHRRGGPQVRSAKKRVAYFHGCYTNYNTPEVGKALVRVFESFGYEVAVPKQGCSGTPMFANGMIADAEREAEITLEAVSALLEDGYDLVASCTSCSMSLTQEYPELFDMDGVEDLSMHTYEALEYLRIHEDLTAAIAEASVAERSFAYHAPCHARNQGLDRQAIELFGELDGVTIEDAGDSCSGISGTYGWKTERYDASMAIGAELFEHMERADGDVGMTECPTCSMQMTHGTGYPIEHPLEVLEDALTG
ncbi:MAG: anaerobic glycerol-3-phosphate dehydrogenase subunit C [Halobacteriota archaeon]